MSKMGKVFANVTKVIVILLILLILAAIIVPKLIDPNKYKGKITDIVKKKTNRNLTIAGDISWALFPNISVTLENANIENVTGFKGNLIKVSKIQFKLKVLPLLRREVALKGVQVNNLELNLIKDKQGLTNIEDLINKKQQNAQIDYGITYIPGELTKDNTLITKVKDTKTNQPILLPNINIGNLDIKNSTINWQDLQAAETFALKNIEMQAYDLNLSKNKKLPPINFSATVESSKTKTPLDFSAKIITNPVKNYIEFSPLKLSFAGITAQINSELINDFSGIGLKGSLDILPISPQKLFKDKALPAKFSLSSKLEYKNNIAELSNIKAIVDNGEFKGNANIDLNKDKKVKFNLQAQDFNIDKLSQMIAAISAASIDSKELEKAKSKDKKTTNDPIVLPSEILKTINVDGKLEAINTTLMDNAKVDKINCIVKANKGVMFISPINIEIGESLHKFEAKVDATNKTPVLEITGNNEKFDVAKLMQALGKEKVVSGSANYSLSIISRGNTVNSIKRNLAGGTKLVINDGHIYGINIGDTIEKSLAAIDEAYDLINSDSKLNIETLLKNNPSKYNIKPKATDSTQFSKISATTVIKAGVINNNDLVMLSPDFKATGQGNVNIPANKIDYKVKAYLTKLQNDDSRVAKLLNNEPLEVDITGPIEQPNIKPNTEAFIKVAMREAQKKLIKGFAKKVIKKAIGGDIVDIITGVGTAKELTESKDEKKSDDEASNPVEKIFDLIN